MATTRDWRRNQATWIRLLETQTGEGVPAWSRRIAAEGFRDERRLRAWLSREGVSGYAQTLLVMETFGYPDFLVATAAELIARQYADRAHLKPVYDAIVDAATSCGEVIVQARKTYVSLVTPRRTFARVQPATRQRIDLGLRLERQTPRGRLKRSRIHPSMPLQVSLESPQDLDADVCAWLRQAYNENT